MHTMRCAVDPLTRERITRLQLWRWHRNAKHFLNCNSTSLSQQLERVVESLCGLARAILVTVPGTRPCVFMWSFRTASTETCIMRQVAALALATATAPRLFLPMLVLGVHTVLPYTHTLGAPPRSCVTDALEQLPTGRCGEVPSATIFKP